LSAHEDAMVADQPAREQKPAEVRPAKKSTTPAAAPPPQTGKPRSDPFSIPETTVTGAKELEYKVDSATTGTRTDTPIQDIPQSISVVTEKLVESQNAFNLRDALKNVSGLTIGAGEGGRTGDSITLRGYAANADTYLDSAKGNGQYFRDTFFLQRIEVLKGPS